MIWVIGKVGLARGCHMAHIGEGSLALHAYIKNNGSGWFNWCIHAYPVDAQ